MYEKNRALFEEATAYAKKAMADQELKQAYKSKCNLRQNAYVRAVQDFLIAPSIGEIDLSNLQVKQAVLSWSMQQTISVCTGFM